MAESESSKLSGSDAGDEIDDLKRAIQELEGVISKCGGDDPADSVDEAELEAAGEDSVFNRKPKYQAEQLPEHDPERQGPYEQLGKTQEGKTVRGPRVREAKSRGRRRSGVKTIRSDWDDVRKAKLSNLSQPKASGTDADEPVESRRHRIEFEEDRVGRVSSGGWEMARATIIARVLALMLFVVVLGSVVALALNAHKRSDVIETSEGSAAVSQEMRKLLGDMELAKSSIAAFWNASSLNEKLKHVWEADRVAPLMEAYYRHHPLPTAMSEEGPNIRSNRSVSRHSEVPARFVVATVIDSVGLSHDLLLRPKEEGYLIDWEASVGYNASDLSKLINLRHPEPVTLRVNITPASYYNYQYADHRAFQSFAIQVTDPNEPRCYAFALRESEVAKALMRLFANRAQRAVAVTLSMRFPEGGDEGAELLELVKPHWVGE